MNRGGLECRLMDIYRNLDYSRIQFDFFTLRKEPGHFDNEIIALGGKMFYNEMLDIKHIFTIPMRIESFLNSHKEYRIVHAYVNQWCGLVLKGAQNAGISKRIAHSRTSLEVKTVKNIVKDLIKIPVKKYATHCFAVSSKAGDWLFGPNSEYEVWPNAIDVMKFKFSNKIRQQIRKELGLKNEFTIIHIGNIRPEKNHVFLLEIFSEILKLRRESKLLFIGKDLSRGRIINKAKELCVNKDVKFLGLRNDVEKLLQAGDVFVFPSLYEGLPGAVLEAQAAGLPCIISDTITKEVCITPLVKQLPLSLPAGKWAEIVLKQNIQRVNTQSYFEQTGFDINNLVEKLTEFYINISEV
jgi:glycosyltransferase involved in cell wall biosynthesis